MVIRIHKKGLTKNGRPWICATCTWSDKFGKNHTEYFFVKPWNQDTFEECVENDIHVEEQIKAIYGENSR